MVLTNGEIAYLAAQRLGRLATARPDGTLQNNPVACHYNPDLQTIDIGGRDMATSQKYRNVRRNGHVALVVDDVVSVQPWRVRCLEIRGKAEAIDHPTETATGYDSAIIRIRPRRIVSWGIDPPELARGKRDVPAPPAVR